MNRSVNRILRRAIPALALAVAAALPGTARADADDAERAEHRARVERSVAAETGDRLAQRRTRLVEEAVSALERTHAAIGLLEEGRRDEALEALAVATGKLETVVARSPELALAPVAVGYRSTDVLAGPEAIDELAERIEDLVDDGALQAARAMLRDFASEVVIETASLPLATYPDAILEATRLADDGRTEEAIAVLDLALSTQVVSETVIALPPLRAEAMLDKARERLDGVAADGAGGSDEAGADAPTAADYLAAARQELEVAEALGYGRERDFAELHEALDEIDARLEAETDAGGLFATLGERFERLKDRLFDASRT